MAAVLPRCWGIIWQRILPSLFGAASGHSTAGQSNSAVAALFSTYFGVSGAKTKAQVMAGALACYVTSTTLSGGSYAGQYGFNLSSAGTCADIYNVGSNGSALGLLNNHTYTVGQLLQVANADGPTWTSAVSNALNSIFGGINQAGDIQ